MMFVLKGKIDLILLLKKKESLESDKDKALEFIEKEKQLVIEKATLTQYEIYQNNRKIQTTLTKLTELKNDIDKKKSENNTLLDSKKNIENEIETLKQKLDNLEEEIKNLTDENRELNTIKVSNEEILKNVTRKKSYQKILLRNQSPQFTRLNIN